jgi:hypothetical protein
MRERIMSPQEKKQLSLTRDRRNTYGQSDKGSKKLIPQRKRQANKLVRRSDQLLAVIARAEGEQREVLEGRIDGVTAVRLRMRWRKFPNEALGAVITKKDERRRRIGQKATRQTRQP